MGGWFDSPLARKAAHLNFYSSIALTKLNVLNGIDPIKICISYELEDRHRVAVAAKDCVHRIEEILGVGIWIVLIGPKGKQVLFVE